MYYSIILRLGNVARAIALFLRINLGIKILVFTHVAQVSLAHKSSHITSTSVAEGL